MADRHCDRCDRDVDERLWTRGDDHVVAISGPLAMDRVAVDREDNTVTYRASEPFITTTCSEFDRTVAALNIEIERPA